MATMLRFQSSHMPYKDQAKANECSRRRRQRHKELGLCSECDAPALGSQTRCERCFRRQKVARENMRKKGLCAACGAEPRLEGFTIGATCRENFRAKIVALRGSGTCIACGLRPIFIERSTTRCLECCDANKAKAMASRRSRLERGTCADCGLAPPSVRIQCLRCWYDNVAQRYRIDAADLCQLWEHQGGCCALTGETLIPGVNASLDHVVPVKRGGTADITNVRWVTIIVNQAKRDFGDPDFFDMCRKIAARFPE